MCVLKVILFILTKQTVESSILVSMAKLGCRVAVPVICTIRTLDIVNWRYHMFTDWCMVIHFLAGHGFLKLPASSLLTLIKGCKVTIIVGKSERFFLS